MHCSLAGPGWSKQSEAPSPEPAVTLTPPPLRRDPSGLVFPADEAPLSLLPPAAAALDDLWDEWQSQLDDDDHACWDSTMSLAWALGRPESLTEALARLGRNTGASGRRRRIRDLGDQLGLCGIWG